MPYSIAAPVARLYELASQLTRMGAWSVDVPSGRIFWSDQVCLIHEVPIGTTPTVEAALAFYAPQCRQKISDAFHQCVAHGIPYDLELQLVTAAGRSVWVRAIGEPSRGETGEIIQVQGAFQDITSIKQAGEDARFLAARLINTLESITDAFFTLDHEWRFTYLNGEAARCLQRSKEDLEGKICWEEFPEAINTAIYREYHRAMRENIAVSFKEYYPPLQKWLEVRAYPSTEGLTVYFQDVSEQRAANEALRESEARFRYVARATADTIWDWDLITNQHWWNDGLERVFGYSRADIQPGVESWISRLHPEDREPVVRKVAAAIACKTESWSDEYRFLRKDGTYAAVMDRGFIIFNEQGTAVRMVGGMTDMSEEKRFEEQRRDSQHLEALGQLTGGVAHDFNNLLTVILGNSEVLVEHLKGNDRMHMLADMIHVAAHRAANLTARLLAFARRQTLDNQAVRVDELIADMQELLRRTLGEHIEVKLKPSAGACCALIDAAQLEAAVLNLGINARDAMPSGGTLTIRTKTTYLAANNDQGLAAGDYVMIGVKDTGTGMPEHVMARAFEPFFTTKEVGKGSGLGLSMVYGFAKQSGGHVKIQSELGKGTVIRMYLPRAERVPQVAADKAAPSPAGTEQILLVEDDDLVRSQVLDQLTSMGYCVTAVQNGAEALALLRQRPTIDLLFTDMVMPGGLNGRELAQEAWRLMPDLAVLFTSGYTDDELMKGGRLDRPIQFLHKPYNRHELGTKIRIALGRTSPAANSLSKQHTALAQAGFAACRAEA